MPTPAKILAQILENVNINVIYPNICKSFLSAKHLGLEAKRNFVISNFFLEYFELQNHPEESTSLTLL